MPKKLFPILFAILFGCAITNAQKENTLDSLYQAVRLTTDDRKSEVFLELSHEFFKRRQIDSLLKYTDKTIDYAGRYNKYKDLSSVYHLLANLYSRQNLEKSAEYFSLSLENARSHGDTTILLDRLMSISEFSSSSQPKLSTTYANEYLELAEIVNDTSAIAKAYAILGVNYYYTGEYRDALEYWEKALQLYRLIDDKYQVGTMLTNIGVIYKNWGDYQKASQYYHQNLELQEELGDSLIIARALSNIGNIHYYLGIDFKKALSYYQQSDQIFERLDKKMERANNLNNIGLVYRELGDPGEALVNFRHALKQFEEINYAPGIATANNNIGNIYLAGGNYQDALEYSLKALAINRKIANKKEEASNLRDIGRIYYQSGLLNKALENYNKSLGLNKELGHKREVYEIYRNISLVYEKMNDPELALANYKLYNELKDSTLSEEYLKQISELETKYETDKKERELQLQSLQLAEKEAESIAHLAEIKRKEAEVKRQQLLLFSFIIGIILIGIFSNILQKQIKDKNKINIQLEEQNIEIKQQRDKILQQNKEITDSILYASKIQEAILPPHKILEKNVEDYFILNLPRNIVSGDFYWMTEVESKTVVAAADCTGHGVPGAFMSMLGVTFLDEIVNKNKITKANQILNALRDSVVGALHQKGQPMETKDGMDVALVVIDHENMQIEYSGAFNPLYLFRDGKLKKFQADKIPIGIHFLGSEKFHNTIIPIQKSDFIYLFSDGFMDQFGGQSNKKYMAGNFRKKLKEIHSLPGHEQKEILLQTFLEWKGNTPQIDDILVVGMRI